MTERRNHPRIPLEDMLYIQIVSAGKKLSTVLLDISVSGARMGMPPNEALPSVGSEITFTDTSLLAPFLENRKATVLWGVGVQFGVRFMQQLDAPIEDIAELLRSEIFYS